MVTKHLTRGIGGYRRGNKDIKIWEGRVEIAAEVLNASDCLCDLWKQGLVLDH